MKMLIRSYNRAESITTPDVPAFAELDRIVLVHNEAEAIAYGRALRERTGGRLPRWPEIRITYAGVGRGGQVRQMAAGMQQICEPGEWIVLADDDVREVQAVPEPWYSSAELPVQSETFEPPAGIIADDVDSWDALYKRPAGPGRFAEIIADSIRHAERIGARCVGFGTTRNFYFRARHWREVGYVMGGLRLWRYDPGYRFDDRITMDDFRDSAEHLRRYGAVLINNYVHAVCGMYIDGGLGRHADRLADRERDLRDLDALYPGLFRIHRKGDDGYPDLRIRLTSPVQVERWRRLTMAQMGAGL